MKPRAALEYSLLRTDPDRFSADANSYAEKGWRVVTVFPLTPARLIMIVERKKAEE